MLNIKIRDALRMRGMLVIGALAMLTHCSTENDTVVAVNVAFDKIPHGLSTLAVEVTQAGQSPVMTTITPPTMEVDGGSVIKSMFNQRIQLPDSWKSGPATVQVDAKSASGETLASENANTNVRDDGAVAVFVMFSSESPDDSDAGI